jgi:hypothetical protein
LRAPFKDFSDVHGSPQQRLFNLICLAYGADPVLFADVVKFLPEDRARGCRYEYGNVAWAFHELIRPNLDHVLAKQVMDQTWLPPGKPGAALRHQERFSRQAPGGPTLEELARC